MNIANQYNHLNAREFLIVNKMPEYNEILDSIAQIDANQFLKISCDAAKLGQVFYSQTRINAALKKLLKGCGWRERKVSYYVTGDEQTTRDIISILDGAQQKQIIESRGYESYSTFNQVDFQKARIAVEAQFGKYFSVAYDLHVKHTFFYSRNDIDVGIEIIPTKAMEMHMDTGVPWFENEVTNVIREGRTNPPVPILMLGVEPENICSREPEDYGDVELAQFLRQSDINKLRSQIVKVKAGRMGAAVQKRITRMEHCFAAMGI